MKDRERSKPTVPPVPLPIENKTQWTGRCAVPDSTLQQAADYGAQFGAQHMIDAIVGHLASKGFSREDCKSIRDTFTPFVVVPPSKQKTLHALSVLSREFRNDRDQVKHLIALVQDYVDASEIKDQTYPEQQAQVQEPKHFEFKFGSQTQPLNPLHFVDGTEFTRRDGKTVRKTGGCLANTTGTLYEYYCWVGDQDYSGPCIEGRSDLDLLEAIIPPDKTSRDILR